MCTIMDLATNIDFSFIAVRILLLAGKCSDFDNSNCICSTDNFDFNHIANAIDFNISSRCFQV